jgi:ABC-2 type transport system ATP-binding protein/lipopolysaccharide transport system ATP-binding protein
MGNAIELEAVSKRYRLGEGIGLASSVREALDAAVHRRGRRPSKQEIWSLRDVSLAVGQGEVLGIVGRNGAGKSTLLRIVTRITEPTSGVSRTRGRVGSLLEVGTGFHPELTGRENVFLSGAILGMGRRRIERRFQEIVSFAGVERFVDTPMKRYSSGMQLRLGFAVAAHLDAEIMVVDEVLAVGDAEFQGKCLAAIAEIGRSGRTVLFVSHNLEAVVRLCPRAIWLEKGRVVGDGPSQEIIDAYLASGSRTADTATFPPRPDAPAHLESIAVLDPRGRPGSVFASHDPFTIELLLDVRDPRPTLDFSVILHDQRGLRILDHPRSDHISEPLERPGRYRARLTVPAFLPTGQYTVGVWIGTAYETMLEETPLTIRLDGPPRRRPNRVLDLPLAWDVVAEQDGRGPPQAFGGVIQGADGRHL